MTMSGSNRLLDHIQRMTCSAEARDQSDQELLRRFVRGREEAAFTRMLQRHGPMVWGVCRSLLDHDEDAEDVFQATFLVLNRRAESIRNPAALASWLHGVAVRLARKRFGQIKRQPVSSTELDRMPARSGEDVTWRELRRLLHEELYRLPEKNRLPVLLCHLEELTQDEAARRLGWSLGRLRGRLRRGREILRGRLARRGIDLSTAILAAIQLHGRAVAVGAPSPRAARLAEELLGSGLGLRSKLLAGMVLFGCCLGSAIGLPAYLSSREKPPAVSPAPRVEEPETTPSRKDALGDPLPPDVLFRLGTTRLRHGGSAASLVFSPDGSTLLSAGGQDAKIRRWDVATGKERESILGPEEGILKVVASADRRILAAGCKDGRVHLFDRKSGREVQSIRVPETENVSELALSGDGRLLVTGGRDFAVRLWNVTTGKELRLLHTHTHMISDLAISPDGKRIASTSYDRVTRVLETAGGKELFQVKADPRTTHVLRFSPDGSLLLTGDQGAILLWDVRTEQQLLRVEVERAASAVAFDAEGKRFAAASGQRFHVWETETGKELHRIVAHPDTIQSLVFSPDGKTLASGCNECTIRLWNMETGKERRQFTGHEERVTDVAVSPDGKVIATAAWDQTVRVWSTESGKELRKLQCALEQAAPQLRSPSFIQSLAFSPDGKKLAADIAEGVVVAWNWAEGKELWRRQGSGVDFSSDGKHLAIAGPGTEAFLIEAESGKKIRELQGHVSHVRKVRFSPDGSTLATVSQGAPIGLRIEGEKFDQQALWLWDVATGQVRARLPIALGPAGLAFSPDGAMLASADFMGNKVKLWETATGKKRGEWTGPRDMIFDVAFSSDGRFLAAGSLDKFIHLWHIPTGKAVRRLAGHRSWVDAVAFVPESHKLVSGSIDTTALLWDLTSTLDTFRLPPVKLTPSELRALWENLAMRDAEKAYDAMGTLVASPKQSVPFLAVGLKPAEPVKAERVAKLIADLDAKSFAVREKATRALAEMGELAETALRRALADPPSLEARQRVAKLLERLESEVPTPEQLRARRAVEVLELLATREAREILKRLAKGEPGSGLTEQATAALRRLSSADPRSPRR